MVMDSMPLPAWLSPDAPSVDVVISTRVRIMRNLVGYKFPNRASQSDLIEIAEQALEACRGTDFEAFRRLTSAERDYLVAARLVSPDFEWTAPGRALLVDSSRTVSLMINEEDHVRLQALSAGWSIRTARTFAEDSMRLMSESLDFARSPQFGYLAASPYNSGRGQRLSGMFHLIGLAQSQRLSSVMKALSQRGLMVRGVFGESSRAIGAIAQVSILNGEESDFSGACEYLIREEGAARAEISRVTLHDRAERTREFILKSHTLGLADALRSLAWLRWASLARIPGFERAPREIDAVLARLDLRSDSSESRGAQRRLSILRGLVSE